MPYRNTTVMEAYAHRTIINDIKQLCTLPGVTLSSSSKCIIVPQMILQTTIIIITTEREKERERERERD